MKLIRLSFFAVILISASNLLADGTNAPSVAINKTADSRIDELVFGRLKELGIPPSESCSDEVFVRRAFVDVIGTLPTAREAREFINSKNKDKRSALIDELLNRDEFTEYWTMKWSDLLKVKAEFPSNLWPNGAQAYHEWIRSCIKQNMPYDKFVRELLISNGSNFRVPQVNFYRALPQKNPQKILEGVALTFMGARTKSWSEEQRMGMAAFFAKIGYKSTGEWKEEIIFFDPAGVLTNSATGKPQEPVPLGGKPVMLAADADPRTAFADWLTAKDNPWFARNIVNRIWYWLLGRGIIHEPDDIRTDNPPQNEELLKYLEKELVSHDYDLKHIYRIILNSRAYQLSAEPKEENRNDVANFSHYYVRRMDAEVLIDALCMITGTDEKYTSQIPEPFTYIEKQRAVSLADGSVTSPFLEMFGRPPRDTGYESERNNEPSITQRLHFLNSTHVLDKLKKGGGIKRMMRQMPDDSKKIHMLYMSILSRSPTADEEKTAGDYLQSDKRPEIDALLDLAWALLNTKEFLYRH